MITLGIGASFAVNHQLKVDRPIDSVESRWFFLRLVTDWK